VPERSGRLSASTSTFWKVLISARSGHAGRRRATTTEPGMPGKAGSMSCRRCTSMREIRAVRPDAAPPDPCGST
jgi:hypothetical protein